MVDIILSGDCADGNGDDEELDLANRDQNEAMKHIINVI